MICYNKKKYKGVIQVKYYLKANLISLFIIGLLIPVFGVVQGENLSESLKENIEDSETQFAYSIRPGKGSFSVAAIKAALEEANRKQAEAIKAAKKAADEATAIAKEVNLAKEAAYLAVIAAEAAKKSSSALDAIKANEVAGLALEIAKLAQKTEVLAYEYKILPVAEHKHTQEAKAIMGH